MTTSRPLHNERSDHICSSGGRATGRPRRHGWLLARWFCGWLSWLWCATMPLHAQTMTEPIAARVNGSPIYTADVEYELARALGRRQVAESVREQLRSETLEQLVRRQLVLEWLAERKQAATEADVDLMLQRLSKQLEARGSTLNEHLDEIGFSEPRLRARFRWTLSWDRLLDRYLTDENLERFFEQHRRDFDGTLMRVAHILWKVDASQDTAPFVREAEKVREKLVAGELDFATAARTYSAAPTAERGGEIGWIERHEPMPAAFSNAAFQLDPGEISQPVITSFGVHLIHCIEIAPGQKTWKDARGELEREVAKFIFRWASDQRRAKAQIELVGNIPLPPANP